MYAKLFSRITESSLMEEDVPTRYVFMMLLAIADPYGYVIGTDVAIARRMNVSLADFKAAVERLSAPDPDSNSKELDGRRLVPSDGERGYRLVNYLAYRRMRDEQGRREYMSGYMRVYRASGKDHPRKAPAGKHPVNTGKHGKPGLAQAEAEAEEEEEEERERGAVAPRARTPSHFVPPTPEEAKAFAAQIGLAETESATFLDHYTANGWRVGKNPMRDWQAAMRNWGRRNLGSPVNGAKPAQAQLLPWQQIKLLEERKAELARKFQPLPTGEERSRLVAEYRQVTAKLDALKKELMEDDK